MKFQKYTIKKDFPSVYIFLKEHSFSENYIKNLRRVWGNIIINDTIVNINAKLKIGDTLKINSNPNLKTSIKHCILPLDIVFEDEYYLLINKPSGISCMPNKSHYSNNLSGAIAHYMASKDDNFVVRILNRLDKDTAGIVIVAKDSISQKEIKNVEKTYHAICKGIIPSPLTIDKPIKTISENGINQHKRIIANDGQEATTFVRPIKSNCDINLSLIKLELIHGRTHQIRIHLSSIQHPLLGDELYGEKSEIINHSALICKQVSFYHPFLNKVLSFEVDYPDDFKEILNTL